MPDHQWRTALTPCLLGGAIIQLLIKSWPDSVCEKDYHGMLPLHYAIEGGCTNDGIQFLVESWPQSVQIADKRGLLPLHNACKKKYLSLAVIQSLVQAWPDAVRLQDDEGCLPLHTALEHAGTADVIQFLVHFWPESCHIPTNEGKLPLHLACDKQSLTVILFMLDCYPQAVRLKDKNLQLPLHIACLPGAPLELEVIQHLIQAWPESIQIPCPYSYIMDYTHDTDENDGDNQDSDLEHHDDGLKVDDNVGGSGGNDEHTLNADKSMQCNALPLDLACARERKPSPELIRVLTNNMPPLHFLCTHAAKCWGPRTIVTMEYLISLFPDDPQLFHHGMQPFHCACRVGATRSLLKWWWKTFLDIVQEITTDTGDMSLHCYLSSTYAERDSLTGRRERKQCLLAVQFLVEKHPDSLRKFNRMGMLPFHITALHQAPLDVMLCGMSKPRSVATLQQKL